MSAARMAVDPFSEPERDVLRVLALNATAALDRAERETELARKNERLDEFTSVVSHDLRNPLSLIRGHTELAMETGETDALEEVLAAADRMDRLIDDLLTLARQGDLIGETEPVSVDGVTERAWEAVQTGDAALTVDAGSAAVEADPERLRELLENLFRNSVEHGAEAEDSTDAAVTVHVTVDPAAEQFVVADDGIGIPPDERENVLNHGYSTAADGTGFGLAIVDRIADGHDWTVSIDESETGGARFCFENVTIRE